MKIEETSEEEEEKQERDSLKVGYCYQPKPHGHHKKERKAKEVKVDLPHFHGKNDVEIFLDWEMNVEQLFDYYHVSEERKVPLATLSFQGHAMCHNRNSDGDGDMKN